MKEMMNIQTGNEEDKHTKYRNNKIMNKGTGNEGDARREPRCKRRKDIEKITDKGRNKPLDHNN